MKKETSGISTEVRYCETCKAEMEYNPVTGGYLCTICGRIDKPNKGGFHEDNYRSKNKITATTDELSEKKCPSCGGVLNYDFKSKKLVCSFCKTKVDLDIDDAPSVPENDFETEKRRLNHDWGFKTKTVVCDSCGGRTVYDFLEIAGKCLYCGSNQVTEIDTVNTIAPGGICPFTIGSYVAVLITKSCIKRQLFCPNKVKKNIKLTDIKGLYLPFWTFDTNTNSTYSAKCKTQLIDKNATKGKIALSILAEIGSLIFIEGRTRKISGNYSKFFNDILIPASANYDNSLQKQLEPYKTEKCLPYSPEYISGFGAQVYSKGLDEAWIMAQDECKDWLIKAIKNQVIVNYDTTDVHDIDLETNFSNVTFKCLLLPVWISSFTYKDRVYQFMVNGSTGKFAGKAPKSVYKIAAFVLFTLLCLVIYLSLRYILYRN